MKVTRAHTVLGAGLLTLATAAGIIMPAASQASAGPASAGSSRPVLLDNNGQGQVRPAHVDIGGMANEFLGGLHWASWRTTAFGHGQLNVNNCIPTCAQGSYIKYPVLTVLWRPRPWTGRPGVRYFTRLTLIFTGKHGNSPVTQTMTLPLWG